MLAILDGTIADAAQTMIPVTDEGLLRGDGVFEVLHLYGGRPFALEEHLQRMERSAANLRLPIDIAAIRADVEALLARNDVPEALLRLVVTRAGRRIAIVEPMHPIPDTVALQTVEYSPTRVLDQVKSLSYAANMLALRRAQERGADDALFVTPHGRVLEGTRCSFVASFDGETLVTPPLSEHILDSITRRRLLALIDIDEAVIARDDLSRVREAFVASTMREVHPVRAIDGVDVPQVPGPLTQAAAQRMRAAIDEDLGVA